MKNENGRSSRHNGSDRERENNGKYSSDFNGSAHHRDTSYFRGSQNSDTESGLMDFDQEDRRGRRVWDSSNSDEDYSRSDSNENRFRDDNSDFLSDRNERSNSGSRRRSFNKSDSGSYGSYRSRGNNSGSGYGSYADSNYGNGTISNYENGNYGTQRNADYQNREENEWGGHSQSRSSQPSHRGKGPKGYKRSDERIKEDISDWLTNDHQLDASEVDVTVSDGEVILNGTVSSRNDKRRAEDIAESVSGVTHVQNNIRINRDTNSASSSKSESKSKANGKH